VGNAFIATAREFAEFCFSDFTVSGKNQRKCFICKASCFRFSETFQLVRVVRRNGPHERGASAKIFICRGHNGMLLLEAAGAVALGGKRRRAAEGGKWNHVG